MPVFTTDNADVIDTIVSLHVISPVTVKSPATVTSLLKDLSPAIVCEPVVLTTVESTHTQALPVPLLTVIPSHPDTLVTVPKLVEKLASLLNLLKPISHAALRL